MLGYFVSCGAIACAGCVLRCPDEDLGTALGEHLQWYPPFGGSLGSAEDFQTFVFGQSARWREHPSGA